jgi:hypothetical protein
MKFNVRELEKAKADKRHISTNVIEADEVFVLRVRGPGQAPVQPSVLEKP